jgi:hypothetical protein
MEGDLSGVADTPGNGPKYSSGSSVYADHTIINANYNELTYR